MATDIQLTPVAAEDYDAWIASVRDRIVALRVESASLSHDDAVERFDKMVARLLPDGAATDKHQLLNVVSAGSVVGRLWIARMDADATVYDLVVDETIPAADVMDVVEQRALNLGAVAVKLNAFGHDAGIQRLIAGRGYQPAATQMRLRLDAIPERAPRDTSVVLRPMTQPQFEDFMASSISTFAGDLAESGTTSPELALEESERQFKELLPDGLDSDGDLLWSAYDPGDELTPVGLLWVEIAATAGETRAFIYDLLVHKEFRRRGYGRAIMIAGEDATANLGAMAIGLNVFGFNDGARELYDDLGYEVIEEFVRKVLTD